MLKNKAIATITFAAATALFSLTAAAQNPAEKTERLERTYNNTLFCAAILKKLGGNENLKKSKRAFAESKKLAPEVGKNTDKLFNDSYTRMVEIVATFNKEEMDQRSKDCISTW